MLNVKWTVAVAQYVISDMPTHAQKSSTEDSLGGTPVESAL